MNRPPHLSEAEKPFAPDEIEGLMRFWPRIVHTLLKAERDLQAAQSALATAREEIERLKEGLRRFLAVTEPMEAEQAVYLRPDQVMAIMAATRVARALLQSPAPSREG